MEAFLSFLQLENLQNYLQQNKLKAINKTLEVDNSGTKNFLETLDLLVVNGYKSFIYTGNNPIKILCLIILKLHNEISVSLSEEPIGELNFSRYKSSSLFISKAGENEFSIFTSGTTGKPKKVVVDLEDLILKITPTNDKNFKWILTYNPKSFAGLQVLLTAVISDNVIYFSLDSSVTSLLKIIQKYKINAVSATPTFWRVFLSSSFKDTHNLELITLGGELIEESLLKKLVEIYPDAKITQIYATTEFGKIFSVSDKKAGFPIEFINKYKLKIKNDELFVKYENEYMSTKDKVKIMEDRLFFVGRNSDFLKVAGNKVNIKSIEQKLLNLKNVSDAKINFQSSKIVGNILTLDVVLVKDNESERMNLKKMCRSTLETYEIPKIINFLPVLKTNSNLKK